ncbi:hypothetical protein [Streptomyces marianii]|uniref:Uncharacterized protein n=1 Tax=Streptomyces marianii TaxID=1817406 RepID=A0A5R9DS09_9ACTN|nr:hypothetical protein [Streptomyces marianii]TLQ39289.1 hypothetical protein FEF34_38500 [Streptomyces marianii]
MSNTTLHLTYLSAAWSARQQASALQLLITRARQDPYLALALAHIDTTEMKGVLDAAGMGAALAEAEAERDLNAALAERCRRREAVQAEPGTPCVCRHSPATHARRLTAQGKLPCRHDGCGCTDLSFV